jgi:hypothetical protein
MKAALEKVQGMRKFVSPSYATDIKDKLPNAKSSFKVSDAAGLAMTLWPMRRYPKLTVMALIAAGIYIGVTRSRAKKRAHTLM